MENKELREHLKALNPEFDESFIIKVYKNNSILAATIVTDGNDCLSMPQFAWILDCKVFDMSAETVRSRNTIVLSKNTIVRSRNTIIYSFKVRV